MSRRSDQMSAWEEWNDGVVLSLPETNGEKLPSPEDRPSQTERRHGPSHHVIHLSGFGPSVKTLTESRYQLIKVHAQGGLGEVLVAEDTELNRTVAVKRLQERCADNQESRSRFLREAEITGRLQHPGVVPVYGLTFDEKGRPSYAMRFIEGESLHDAIHRFYRGNYLNPNAVDRGLIFRQLLQRYIAVCNTVAYAHSRGIVHRDIKPSNIMLGKYAETLLCDWGLAKPFRASSYIKAPGEETLIPSSIHNNNASGEQTQIGKTVGTPAYMSPEQARGAWDQISQATDIFSLGATLYAILTGHAPYQGSTTAEVLEKATRAEVVPPHQVNSKAPYPLSMICMKAMATRVEDRYQSAQELVDDIERWFADRPVSACKETWLMLFRRWRKRNRTLMTALTVFFVMVLAGVLIRISTERAVTKYIEDLKKDPQLGEQKEYLEEKSNHFLKEFRLWGL